MGEGGGERDVGVGASGMHMAGWGIQEQEAIMLQMQTVNETITPTCPMHPTQSVASVTLRLLHSLKQHNSCVKLLPVVETSGRTP